MLQARSLLRFSLVAALTAAIGACEPADTGGGGGANGEGHFAFIREDRLVFSAFDGAGQQILTNESTRSEDPALSPNGQRIAFAYSAENDSATTGIFVANKGAATGDVTELASGSSTKLSSPTWDPASANVFYVGDGKIFRIASAGGGSPEQVATGVTDAKWIADIDASTLLVANTAGALSKVAISGSGLATPLNVTTSSKPGVSSDGTLIAYSNASGAIVVRNLASGSETTMPTGAGRDANPSFSPDAANVAFDSGGTSFFTLSSGQGNRQTLFTNATSPSWSQ